MEKALGLPEILECIGCHLNRIDILSCIRVCKAWKTEFEPRLWRSFTLRFPVAVQSDPTQQKQILSSFAEGEPSQTQMQQNAKHIRRLTLDTMNLHYGSTLFRHCSNLDEVTFMPALGRNLLGAKDRTMTVFGEMIKNHPRLRKIVVEPSEGYVYITHEFLEDLEACPKLIVLETNDCIFNGPLTEEYMRACASNIRRLSCNGDVFPFNFTIQSDILFKELRYFDLRDVAGMSEDTQLSWISRCPNLISLRWETGSDISAREFSRIIPSACPNLTALHLMSSIGDKDIAMILRAIPRIEKLSLTSMSAGREAFEALRRHFPTLKDINLQFCTSIGSPMIQEILSSCPKLQSISAEILKCEDMPEQQPWVCRDLQLFDIGIQFAPRSFLGYWDDSETEDRIAQQRSVYGRLAQLTGLQYLSICNNSPPPNRIQENNWLQLSLNAGLEQLGTLKQLKFFSCKHFMATMFDSGEGSLVVGWILKHWTMLESLEGMTCENVSTSDATVFEMMMDHNVEFIDYFEYLDAADGDYIFDESQDDEDDDEDDDEFTDLENDYDYDDEGDFDF